MKKSAFTLTFLFFFLVIFLYGWYWNISAPNKTVPIRFHPTAVTIEKTAVPAKVESLNKKEENGVDHTFNFNNENKTSQLNTHTFFYPVDCLNDQERFTHSPKQKLISLVNRPGPLFSSGCLDSLKEIIEDDEYFDFLLNACSKPKIKLFLKKTQNLINYLKINKKVEEMDESILDSECQRKMALNFEDYVRYSLKNRPQIEKLINLEVRKAIAKNLGTVKKLANYIQEVKDTRQQNLINYIIKNTDPLLRNSLYYGAHALLLEDPKLLQQNPPLQKYLDLWDKTKGKMKQKQTAPTAQE